MRGRHADKVQKKRNAATVRRRVLANCKARQDYQLPTKATGEADMRRFDHIDLRIKEMAVAQEFYGRILPELGFSVFSTSNQWCVWQAPGSGPVEFFCLDELPSHQPNDNRIAFWAESRDEVDRLAEIVRRAGGLNLEGPALWREYSPGYYAVFFEDPSGNKLEICCRESRPT